jgi:hypothetical protein
MFSVRYRLRLKKQLNIKHVIQHSTTKWQHSNIEINACFGVRIKKRPGQKCRGVKHEYSDSLLVDEQEADGLYSPVIYLLILHTCTYILNTSGYVHWTSEAVMLVSIYRTFCCNVMTGGLVETYRNFRRKPFHYFKT